jgi:transposase
MPVRDPRKGGAARKYDDRLVLDAVFFVLRSGCQWRMIPHDLLPWDAAYRWYRTWATNGDWDRIHDALRDQVRAAAGRNPHPSAAVLDAQSIKTSEGGADRGFDMGKKTTGRKRHLVVDTLGLLLVVIVTAACVQDRPGGRRILQQLAARFPSIALVWADGGYANSIDNTMIGWAKEKLGLLLQIVKRSDNVKGFQVLPRRWVVERTFGWLVRNRRLARDYERLTANSEAMIKIAMIRLMATRLAGQAIRWSNATEREAARRLNIEAHLTA